MKQRLPLLLVLLVSLFLVACSASATPVSQQNSPTFDDTMEEPAVAPEEAEREAAAGGNAAPPAPPSDTATSDGDDASENSPESQELQTGNRQIIYTASLMLEVDDPRGASQALYGLATRYGGFVSNGNVYEYSEDEEGNPIFRADMQLRVDAEKFTAAQEELRGMANLVVSEQVDTQDVTAEFTDVQSRIRNLESLEAELQILLTEARERSDDMEQVLSVYRELTSVREQIEVMQGRINVLSDLVGLATINVTLIAPETDPTPIALVDEEWNPGVTLREAFRALTEDLQGFTDGVIWFAFTGLPRLLIFGLFLYIAYRIGRAVWSRVRPAVTPPPPPPPKNPPPPPPQS
jgi:hypothetical protein